MKLSLFKNRDLSFLFLSEFISLVFSEAQSIALSLFILNKTQSASAFSILLAITTFSSIWFRPFTGVLADKWDRKKLLFLLNLLSAFILFLSLFIFQNISFISIIGIVIALNIIGSFYATGSASLIRALVDKEQLADAYAVKSFIDSCQSLLAPALGAAIYGVFGIKAVFIFNGMSFLVAAGCIAKMKIPNMILLY